ncbi:MAG: polyprenol monophosphomannose synthase [Nitrospinota bacterium]|nr:polyprenol monophosphomannose synthase [Nitrospinota bacterium]
MEKPTPEVSIVIPTYKESENIVSLVKQIAEGFRDSGAHIEIIVVDDNSPDGTADMVEALQDSNILPPYVDLQLIVRQEERGLATAVLAGWKSAKGPLLSVIDGDLQHPPEVIYKLYKAIKDDGLDMAVASRKAEGGGTSDWELSRVIVSVVATWIARFFLPVTLWHVRDATTGCFMFDRTKVDFGKLSPVGFKIFLETLARGKFNKVREVGYVFSQRNVGKSKMTLWQDILFLIHLSKLGLSTGEIAVPLSITVLLVYTLIRMF